jgi:hypothetical protein
MSGSLKDIDSPADATDLSNANDFTLPLEALNTIKQDVLCWSRYWRLQKDFPIESGGNDEPIPVVSAEYLFITGSSADTFVYQVLNRFGSE